MKVFIKRLHSFDLPLPQYMSAAAAGVDLHAAIAEDVAIAPGKWALIPTGIAISMPPDCEAQIRPRSVWLFVMVSLFE